MSKLFPSGQVNPFALEAGDILIVDETEYRVSAGYRDDPSACWQQSRWVRCTQLTGHPANVGSIAYVPTTGATLKG